MTIFRSVLFRPGLLILGLVAVSLLVPCASAQLVTDGRSARVDVPAHITVPVGADTVHVTYRPGSRLATTDALPTEGRSIVTWIPSRVGLATLVAGDVSQNVAVHPAGIPRAGGIVLLLAGGLLIGGAFLAARGVRRSQDETTQSDAAVEPHVPNGTEGGPSRSF